VATDEAHALVREAGDIFDRLASLQQTARNLSQTGGGHIRLGTVPSLALDVLPQAMAQFRRDWPRVTFEVHTYHHDDLVRSLIERETDVAIAYIKFILEDFRRLFSNGMEIDVISSTAEGNRVVIEQRQRAKRALSRPPHPAPPGEPGHVRSAKCARAHTG